MLIHGLVLLDLYRTYIMHLVIIQTQNLTYNAFIDTIRVKRFSDGLEPFQVLS